MRTLLLLISLMISFYCTSAQSLLEQELDAIADELVEKLNTSVRDENIAIGNFVNANDEASELGKYLAEELSYALVNTSKSFNIIDRMQFKRLLKEVQQSERGLIDPSSVQKLGKLKGITAIVYGKVIERGNEVVVFVKVVMLEEQINPISVRGTITLSPTIRQLLGREEKQLQPQNPTENSRSELFASPNTTISYVNQNIKIDLKQCIRNANYLDCQLGITSIGKGDNFSIRSNDSFLTDAYGKSYTPTTMSMNGRNSTIQINQPLQANVTATAILRLDRFT